MNPQEGSSTVSIVRLVISVKTRLQLPLWNVAYPSIRPLGVLRVEIARLGKNSCVSLSNIINPLNFNLWKFKKIIQNGFKLHILSWNHDMSFTKKNGKMILRVIQVTEQHTHDRKTDTTAKTPQPPNNKC